jgi:hypothetical protein
MDTHGAPSNASSLPDETWFVIITRQSIRRGTFSSVKILIAQIRDYLAHWNKDPKPFVWTAATTLVKVQLVKAVSRSSSTTTPNNDTRITRR